MLSACQKITVACDGGSLAGDRIIIMMMTASVCTLDDFSFIICALFLSHCCLLVVMSIAVV